MSDTMKRIVDYSVDRYGDVVWNENLSGFWSKNYFLSELVYHLNKSTFQDQIWARFPIDQDKILQGNVHILIVHYN